MGYLRSFNAYPLCCYSISQHVRCLILLKGLNVSIHSTHKLLGVLPELSNAFCSCSSRFLVQLSGYKESIPPQMPFRCRGLRCLQPLILNLSFHYSQCKFSNFRFFSSYLLSLSWPCFFSLDGHLLGFISC